MTVIGVLNTIIIYSTAGAIVTIMWVGAWMLFEQTDLGQAIINSITKEKDE